MTTYGTIPTSSTSGGSNLEYLSHAKHQLKSSLTGRRPWKEMFNLHSVTLPHGVPGAVFRLKTNLSYFRMNYAIIVLIILFLSLLWHPISLIVFVVLMSLWLFLYFLRDDPLVIVHRVIDDRVVLVVLSVVTIVVLLFTGVTVNVLVAVLVGVVVVVVHGVGRMTEDLCLDDDGAAEAGGYLVASHS